jgi:centromere protein C
VPDSGIRDENGLEPMDHLFSSPDKPKAKPIQRLNGTSKNANATISTSEDMEVDEGESTRTVAHIFYVDI